MKVRPARHVIAWGLKATGFKGVTLPWGIYVLPDQMDNERLIRHEQMHAAQIQSMGTVKFYVTYLWQMLRHGYHNAPLEKQARDAETVL